MMHNLIVLLWGVVIGYNIANFEVAIWLFRKGYTSSAQIKDRVKQD